MNNKKASILFLIIIIIHIAVVLGIACLPSDFQNYSDAWDLFLGEFIILIPSLIFCAFVYSKKDEKLTETICIKKIKAGSVVMTIIYALCLLPLAVFFNAITLLFTENVILGISETLLKLPPVLVIFAIGIFGPICEEFVFRGLIFGGMKKSVRISAAVFMSALAFGLMHMNFNQALYAFVLGIFMALAYEATGSIIASVIVHMTINMEQVMVMLLEYKFNPGLFKDAEALIYTKETIYLIIAIYMVIALVTTTLAVCALFWIAEHEGKTKELKDALPIPTKQKKVLRDSKVLNLPIIVAIVFSFLYMFFILAKSKGIL